MAVDSRQDGTDETKSAPGPSYDVAPAPQASGTRLATGNTADWVVPSRYRIVRQLGEGGMGVVYEAEDRERGHPVALKTLLRFDASALYRFKQEFRTLADVQHPNLVRLYELVIAENGGVFFTMELVSGSNFLGYVRRPGVEPLAHESSAVRSLTPTRAETGSAKAAADAEGPRPSAPASTVSDPTIESPADIDKLRDALRQLVDGVHALHGAGKLHRDIKPSNVLVTAEGRVVILDFGVATELAHMTDANLSEGREIVGTVRYMAPEQATADVPNPAADWYSVGVVLFEALVGRAPFSGPAADVITMKLLHDAPSPAKRVADVPGDLDRLCTALLDRDPKKRPTGPEILRQLDAARKGFRPAPSIAPLPERQARLIGREPVLRSLRGALARVVSGESVTVRVTGASGMGKSAVAQEFLDEIVASGESVVLRGRAYERESVPYKAIDSVVDALSRYLVHLVEGEGRSVQLPTDFAALARVFPVLRRVPGTECAKDVEVADPRVVRQRAFGALRELLGELGALRPLVVFIDDVQWGDADSAALLLDLVRQPDAPRVLFLLAQRDGEAQSAPFVRELRERWPAGAECLDVVVGGLDPADSERLAIALLGSTDAAAVRTARAVSREAGGSPFLIEELVRSNGASPGAEITLRTVTLDAMVTQRLERLPEVARRLLELVVIGGRPLPVSVVAQAADVEGAADRALAAVQARKLIRVGLREGREVVETTHDRLREAILAQLPPTRIREHHARLAGALEDAPGADPEAIAMHLLGADQATRAGQYLEKAADDAASKLAFEQATRLLRLMLETNATSSNEQPRLRARLGEVLEWSGRSEEAAREYLQAAEGAPSLRRAELERAASEQLLAAGRIEEGEQVLHHVLAAVGLRAPRSPLSALFWLIVYRVWARFQGVRYEPRESADVDREDRARIDALFAVSMGFAVLDLVLSACMNTRHVIMALRKGDRFQVLRASVLAITQFAAEGGPVSKRERALTEVARSLAHEKADWEGQDFFDACMGVSYYLRGDWAKARAVLDGAYPKLRNQRAGWQSNANVFGAWTLLFLGEMRELRRRYDRLLADAEARGDLYTSVQLRAGAITHLWLAHDEPDTASRLIREALGKWCNTRFLIQHWQAMIGESNVELYLGRGDAAYERVLRDEAALRRSLLQSSQFVRVYTFFVRGCGAVASAGGSKRDARIAEARRLAGNLEREAVPYAGVFAALLGAAASQAAGDSSAAAAGLRKGIERCDAMGMRLFGASARLRLAGLVGGEEGRELRQAAQEVAAEQDVPRLDLYARTIVAGNWPDAPHGCP